MVYLAKFSRASKRKQLVINGKVSERRINLCKNFSIHLSRHTGQTYSVELSQSSLLNFPLNRTMVIFLSSGASPHLMLAYTSVPSTLQPYLPLISASYFSISAAVPSAAGDFPAFHFFIASFVSALSISPVNMEALHEFSLPYSLF